MPEIHKSEKEIREKFKLPPNKNPDLKIGQYFIDVKSPFSSTEIRNNANKANRQKAIVCITDDHCILKESLIDEYASDIFRSKGYNSDIVYFVINNKLYKCNRQNYK